MKSTIHFFLRIWIRLISYFFFDKIKVTGLENLPEGCPVIFACNHPNAFLDSLVMTTCVKRPLHYIARGDFFKSKIASGILRSINILPVYRREEGKELMYKNNKTFSYCIDMFKKNGALVIFSEGLSENKWELRPLRKGTARLAFEAWNDPEIADKLKVVPVAIHYSSWMKIHPVLYIEFLEKIEKSSFGKTDESGYFNRQFNEKLKERLSESCVVVDKSADATFQNRVIGFMLKNFVNGVAGAKKLQDKYTEAKDQNFKISYKALSDFLGKENIKYGVKLDQGIMRIVNLISWFIVIGTALVYNFIPYFISKFIVSKITKDKVFHDSLSYCILMLIYPLYLIALFGFTTHFVNIQAGLIDVFLAAFSAHYYEAAIRYINAYFKRKQLSLLYPMFNRLFEKENG